MKAVSLQYHDVIKPGESAASGFLHPSSARYKLEREEFGLHLAALNKVLKVNPVTVSDILRSPRGGDHVMLTFDDGGISAYTEIIDLLDRYGWKGHFFIATDYIGHPTFVNKEHLRAIRGRGHVIGSHSSSHPERMSHQKWEEMVREWTTSINSLSDILGEEVNTASVPNGYYSKKVAEAASLSGVKALFTSEPVRSSWMVDNCRVFGRYSIRSKVGFEASVKCVRGRCWHVYKEYLFWNTRKLAKMTGGEAYLILRAYLLQGRRGKECMVSLSSANRHSAPNGELKGTSILTSSETKRSMRVLMVIAPQIGTAGPPVWAARQIESLSRLELDIATYAFQDRRSLRGLLHGGSKLRREAQQFQADLVHVHYGAAQALMAVLFSSKPVILSFCGSDLFGNYDASGRKTWSGVLSVLLSQLGAIGCWRCIAKSEGLKNALWIPFCRTKCEVIPNGIDLDMFQPMSQADARARLGWTHQDPVVLFMDRKGDWVKDPELAHAAYTEARKKIRSLRMHVVENEPPEKMPLFHNAADVLLLTSRHEGSNNTTKEALACNLPVVATACGDISERLHGVRSCYVCPRDARELAIRLCHVLISRERSNGREHIQELALDHVAMRIKKSYEGLLSGHAKLWFSSFRNIPESPQQHPH